MDFQSLLAAAIAAETLLGNLRDFFFFFLPPVCPHRSKSLSESFDLRVAAGKKKSEIGKKNVQKYFFLFAFFSLESWLQPADVQCEEFKCSVAVRRHQKQDSFPPKQQIRLYSLSYWHRRRVPPSLAELRSKFRRCRLSTAGRLDWCK